LPELGEVVDKLAVAFATAQRAIERLERARIIKRAGDAKRDRVLRDCAPGYPRRAGPPQAGRQQTALKETEDAGGRRMLLAARTPTWMSIKNSLLTKVPSGKAFQAAID